MQVGILGKKIGMTQVYDAQGTLHPATVVQAGPCPVLQVKTAEPDRYDAVQLGFDEVSPRRATLPRIGHARKAGARPCRFVQEIRQDAPVADLEPGQVITVEAFADIAWVDVVGTTKGKGTAGVMKRHNFSGQCASHGVERKHRAPGSIASHASNAGTGPKLKKGKRMGGRMGNARCTTRNLRLLGIDKENDLLLIKGALPGANGGFLVIRKSKTAKAAKE